MKTRSRRDFTLNLSFVDMLFNMTVAFSFLFIIAFMLINPPVKTDAISKPKAELILTMTWPDEAFDDIDLWLLTPTGQKVWFSNKDPGLATLDRDDRGSYGDTYALDPLTPGSKTGLIKANKEIITIRANQPGRYVVAAHAYGVRNVEGDLKATVELPYEAELEVLKVNPRVGIIAKAKVLLEKRDQQRAFIAFELDSEGNVSNIEYNPDDMIVSATIPGGN